MEDVFLHILEREHVVNKNKEICLSLEIRRYIPVNGNNKNRESCKSWTMHPRAL